MKEEIKKWLYLRILEKSLGINNNNLMWVLVEAPLIKIFCFIGFLDLKEEMSEYIKKEFD